MKGKKFGIFFVVILFFGFFQFYWKFSELKSGGASIDADRQSRLENRCSNSQETNGAAATSEISVNYDQTANDNDYAAGSAKKIWKTSAETCSPINEKILKAGKIVVHFIHVGETGGLAALHKIHQTLNEIGFESLHYKHNPYYQNEWSRPLQSFDPSILGPNDFVLVPEVARDTELDKAVEARGARMVYWMLAQAEPVTNYIYPNRVRVPSSHYLRDVFMTPGEHVLFSPLEPLMYEESSKRENWYDSKEDLILWDNDCDLWRDKLDLPGVRYKQIWQVPHSEMPNLFRKAKAVVDFRLPGVERAIFEGALFDAVPLINPLWNGKDESDFRFPDFFRADEWNYTHVQEVLHQAIFNYRETIEQIKPFKKHTQDLPQIFKQSLGTFFSGNVAIFTVAYTSDDLAFMWPFIVSAVSQYPLASIEILIPIKHELLLTDFATIHDLLYQHNFMANVHFRTLSESEMRLAHLAPYVLKHGQDARVYTLIAPIRSFFLGSAFVNCWANSLDSDSSQVVQVAGSLLFFHTSSFYSKLHETASRMYESGLDISQPHQFASRILKEIGISPSAQVLAWDNVFDLSKCGEFALDSKNPVFDQPMWHAAFGLFRKHVQRHFKACVH